LSKLSDQFNVSDKVGYILDICIEIARKLNLKIDPEIKKLRNRLYTKKKNKEQLLVQYKSDAYIALAKKDLDPVLKRWNIIARFPTESFIRQYYIYSLK